MSVYRRKLRSRACRVGLSFAVYSLACHNVWPPSPPLAIADVAYACLQCRGPNVGYIQWTGRMQYNRAFIWRICIYYYYYYYKRIRLKCHKIQGLQEHFTIEKYKSTRSEPNRNKTVEKRQTQSGPKHRRKSSALRRRLKAVNDVDEVTLDGRLFHTREAAAGNARSPSKATSS